MEEARFFVDLGYLVVGALVGGALAYFARQPLIIGYILGGILVGPFTPGPTISDPHSFQVFAEIGVVLLMFSIGVEFSVGELLGAGKVAIYGAPVGIVLIVLLTIPIGMILGWPLTQTLVVGGAVSVASTMVILKFLLKNRRGPVGANVARRFSPPYTTATAPKTMPPRATKVAIPPQCGQHQPNLCQQIGFTVCSASPAP